MSRVPFLLGLAALAACAGSPPKEPAPTAPSQGPTTATTPPTPAANPTPNAPADAPAATPAVRPPMARTTKLDSGLQVVLTTTAPNRDAIVQLGLQAGTGTQAAGLAELAVAALVASADASRGRPSLQQAIGALGGTCTVHTGTRSTWLELRVPGARWQEALRALRASLDAPQQSRNQLDRVRDARVAEFKDRVAADPLGAMAVELLLGSSGTEAHANDLVDRDAGEIGAFLSRHLRPDRCVLAIEAPATRDALLAHLRDDGGYAAWKPPAVPGTVPTLERAFPAGVRWQRGGAVTAASQVAIVTALPDLTHPEASAAFLLHACVTLDGTGGRFEQLQREQGLDLHWRGELVQTPDAAALVLRTEATPAQAAAAWRLWTLARQSLRDVPPTAEELTLARRRAPLTARLSLLEAGARGRVIARLALAGRTLEEFDAALAAAANGAPLGDAVTYARGLPAAMVVTGGEPPAELGEVERFTLLPSTSPAPSPGIANAAGGDAKAADAAPWLDKAIEAVGGKQRVLRLHGWTAEARVGNDRAPAIQETLTWRDDGSYERVREVLGQRITTTLQGNDWKEMLGSTGVTLNAREAKLLRDQQWRHPLALLAAHLRGELPFRVVSQRTVDERDLLVLEAGGEREDRLRVHLDAESHLIRAVETWETLPDGTAVHVHDAWSDYRNAQGLRAPHHRLTTQDDGQNRVETSFTRWTPQLR